MEVCWREFGIIRFDLGELEHSQQDLWNMWFPILVLLCSHDPMITCEPLGYIPSCWMLVRKQHSGHNSPGPIFVLIRPMKQWPNFGQSSLKRWHSKFNHISLNGFNFKFKWKFTLVSKICLFSICPILTYVSFMEEILHHLGCIEPCKQWDKLPLNWCRIYSINSMYTHFGWDWTSRCLFSSWRFKPEVRTPPPRPAF